LEWFLVAKSSVIAMEIHQIRLRKIMSRFPVGELAGEEEGGYQLDEEQVFYIEISGGLFRRHSRCSREKFDSNSLYHVVI